MTAAKPLVLTPGEPGGVGRELALMAWDARSRSQGAPFFLLDDPDAVLSRAGRVDSTVPVIEITRPDDAGEAFGSGLPVLRHEFAKADQPGIADPANGLAVISAIERAVDLVERGDASAVVTNPIQKEALYEAGFSHPGHTEFLAHLAERTTGTPVRPVMLLAAPELRVVPVTIHIPLADVPVALTTELIVETARITAHALTQDFGIPTPRLALAGLNPHAGEGGTIGLQDRTIVAPAVERLRAEGIDARGPLPADTMFHADARATYDVALGMYHDQVLIPIKTLDFWGGVNVTAGLPFIRTSPDHGTALERAGTGTARPDSLIAAIDLASQMVVQRAAHAAAS